MPDIAAHIDALLDMNDLCTLLKCSRWSVYNLYRRGRKGPPAIRIGRELRWRKSAVLAWIELQEAKF